MAKSTPARDPPATRRSKRLTADKEEDHESTPRSSKKVKSSALKTPPSKPAPTIPKEVDDDDDDDDDSDDGAPEEVSLSTSRQNAEQIRKAEQESVKLAAEKRKAANRAKEAKLAKSKEMSKKNSLPAEVLSAVLEMDGSKKEREAAQKEEERRMSKKDRIVKTKKEKPSMVEKQGFFLQKVSAKDITARSKKSASEDALGMLAAHFGSVRREGYASVYGKARGPSSLFTPP